MGAEHVYDADGRRISKTVDGTETKFFHDGRDCIADYDGNDTLVATYLTPSLDKNLSQTRSGSTYYYFADGLGSIRNLVDSSQNVQNAYDYYAFGRELGTWTENIANRYTFTAREWDGESQLYYYRNRFYDSSTGRFLERDPLFILLLNNAYHYTHNTPINTTDPTGEADPFTVAVIMLILSWAIGEAATRWYIHVKDDILPDMKAIGEMHVTKWNIVGSGKAADYQDVTEETAVTLLRDDVEKMLREHYGYEADQIEDAKKNLKYQVIRMYSVSSLSPYAGKDRKTGARTWDAHYKLEAYLRLSWSAEVWWRSEPKAYLRTMFLGDKDFTHTCQSDWNPTNWSPALRDIARGRVVQKWERTKPATPLWP